MRAYYGSQSRDGMWLAWQQCSCDQLEAVHFYSPTKIQSKYD
jgi:hypothetical protein